VATVLGDLFAACCAVILIFTVAGLDLGGMPHRRGRRCGRGGAQPCWPIARSWTFKRLRGSNTAHDTQRHGVLISIGASIFSARCLRFVAKHDPRRSQTAGGVYTRLVVDGVIFVLRSFSIFRYLCGGCDVGPVLLMMGGWTRSVGSDDQR